VAIRGEDRRYGFDALEKATDAGWTIHRSFKRLLGSVSIDERIFGIAVCTLLEEYLTSLRAALESRSNVDIESPLEATIGVPANSNSNQRFLTMEGFRRAGFHLIGVYEEPSAAGIEYAHRYRRADITRKREHLLVYDLGGGTFDCSVIRMSGNNHSVIASSGIAQLGGDDFDRVLLGMAMEELPQNPDRLLEVCRIAKERLTPNTRRILLSFDDTEIAIAVDDFYKRCRGLVERTIEVVESMLVKSGGEDAVGCIYVAGGGSEFPLVARALKERFGRRVRKSTYSHAATAIGLAIAADAQSDIRLERTFSRNFGVWRELQAGSIASLDIVFPKGSPLPSHAVRQYRPVHNIGHFRYLECDEVDESNRPIGDIALWNDIRFPFERQFLETTAKAPISSRNGQSDQVEEVYTCDKNGIVEVTIRNLTAGYHRVYHLRPEKSRSLSI
jgi:molecular chaperone DnaK (HSP70)